MVLFNGPYSDCFVRGWCGRRWNVSWSRRSFEGEVTEFRSMNNYTRSRSGWVKVPTDVLLWWLHILLLLLLLTLNQRGLTVFVRMIDTRNWWQRICPETNTNRACRGRRVQREPWQRILMKMLDIVYTHVRVNKLVNDKANKSPNFSIPLDLCETFTRLCSAASSNWPEESSWADWLWST